MLQLGPEFRLDSNWPCSWSLAQESTVQFMNRRDDRKKCKQIDRQIDKQIRSSQYRFALATKNQKVFVFPSELFHKGREANFWEVMTPTNNTI